MIHLERPPADEACAALGKVDSHGLSEREYLLWYFGGEVPAVDPLPSKPTKPRFDRYREQPVKDALIDIFGGKCAYCESHYAHVAAMDVEHYRPKAGYLDDNGKLQKPGYYWLAADWHNLLPSCNDCNRERKHFRRARDGKLVKSKSGKANRFPIAQGTLRAVTSDAVADEVPLLLDPCSDVPDVHLRFLASGFVEPAATPDETALPKGRVSIDIFGLDRSYLVDQRRALSVQIKAAMQAILTADQNVRRYPADPQFGAQLAVVKGNLTTHTAQSGPYRALANAINQTFQAVRSAATNYFDAEAAWRAQPSPLSRDALTQCAQAILALRGAPHGDRKLVEELLAYANIHPRASGASSGRAADAVATAP